MQLFDFHCRMKIYYFSKIKYENLQFIKIKYANGRGKRKMGLKKLEWKADTVSKGLIKWFDDSENRLRDSSRSARSTRFRYHRQNCIATLAQSCSSKESRSRLFYWVLGGKIVFDREKNKRFYVEIKKNRVFIFCG